MTFIKGPFFVTYVSVSKSKLRISMHRKIPRGYVLMKKTASGIGYTWFLRWGLIQSIKKSCRQFLLSHFTPNLSIFCTTYVLFTTFIHSVRFLTFFINQRSLHAIFSQGIWTIIHLNECSKKIIKIFFSCWLSSFISLALLKFLLK